MPRPPPADQADGYVELLDQLGVEKVVTVGYSAGGPSAIALALRHPDRLHALILAASYLPGPGALPTALVPAMRAALRAERAFWPLSVVAPRILARIMGVPKRYRPTEDEQHEVDDIMDHLFPIRAKRRGAIFDALVSEPTSNRYPLEAVTVPRLLVDAVDDPLADYQRAVSAAARIPQAQLATIDRGGHLFLGRTTQVQEATAPFVTKAGSQTAQEDRELGQD